jgi:hypothetical protein
VKHGRTGQPTAAARRPSGLPIGPAAGEPEIMKDSTAPPVPTTGGATEFTTLLPGRKDGRPLTRSDATSTTPAKHLSLWRVGAEPSATAKLQFRRSACPGNLQ